MKKILSFLFVSILFFADAQAQVLSVDSALAIIKEKGYLEQTIVVQVEGADAHTLFRRAMEGFSNVNSDGIEYQDKEEGVILFADRAHVNKQKKTDFYANYQMRVRCKDGRAQLTVKIPSLTAVLNGLSRTIPVTRYLDEKTMKKAAKQAEKNDGEGLSVREIPMYLMNGMIHQLKGAGEDDDF